MTAKWTDGQTHGHKESSVREKKSPSGPDDLLPSAFSIAIHIVFFRVVSQPSAGRSSEAQQRELLSIASHIASNIANNPRYPVNLYIMIIKLHYNMIETQLVENKALESTQHQDSISRNHQPTNMILLLENNNTFG